MASLAEHLRQTGDHGGLPFHRQCPACTSRLSGSPPGEEILPARTAAVVAALALATTAVGPTAAALAAREPVKVGVPETPDPDDGPEEAPTPAEVLEAQQPDPNDGPEPPDEPPELPEQPAVPTAPAATPPAPPAGAPAPSATGAPDTAPVSVPGAPTAPPMAAPAPRPAAPKQAAPQPPESRPSDETRERTEADRVSGSASPAPPGSNEVAVPGALPASGAPAARTPASVEPAAPKPSAPSADGRTHLVRPGETLWSIASGILGENAKPAEIGPLVEKLWALNVSRIRTGDPDLIVPGQRLLLPQDNTNGES